MILRKRPNGTADGGVDDELEQGERRADRIRPKSEGWGGRKETVHDIVRIRGKAYEEEQLGTLLNRPHDTLDRDGA